MPHTRGRVASRACAANPPRRLGRSGGCRLLGRHQRTHWFCNRSHCRDDLPGRLAGVQGQGACLPHCCREAGDVQLVATVVGGPSTRTTARTRRHVPMRSFPTRGNTSPSVVDASTWHRPENRDRRPDPRGVTRGTGRCQPAPRTAARLLLRNMRSRSRNLRKCGLWCARADLAAVWGTTTARRPVTALLGGLLEQDGRGGDNDLLGPSG